MNGRRARHIRWFADTACREQGLADHGPHAYRPQEIKGRDSVYRFPEVRLMPGPRELARRMRAAYTRTGRYPTVIAGKALRLR